MKIKASDGTYLFLSDSGQIDRMTILFIHGWRQSHVAWKYQLHSQFLKDRYRLVAFDLRGHGLSDKPIEETSYNNPTQWGEDIHSIIQACGLKQVVICAWSSGATFLCDYLERYGTEFIKGIVLISPYTRGYGRAKPTGKVPVETYLNLSSEKSTDKLAANENFVKNLTYHQKLAPELYFSFLGFNLTTSEKTGAAFYPRGAYSCTETLQKLKCPSLVIQGEHDAFVSKEDAQEDAKSMNAQFLIYENSGHTPFAEEPEKFNEDLNKFILGIELTNSIKPPTSHYSLTYFFKGTVLSNNINRGNHSELLKERFILPYKNL